MAERLPNVQITGISQNIILHADFIGLPTTPAETAVNGRVVTEMTTALGGMMYHYTTDKPKEDKANV